MISVNISWKGGRRDKVGKKRKVKGGKRGEGIRVGEGEGLE
jgi:hypothetical protein